MQATPTNLWQFLMAIDPDEQFVLVVILIAFSAVVRIVVARSGSARARIRVEQQFGGKT